MKLIPVVTEKSMREAKDKRYTFEVDKRLAKPQIKKLVEETFDVHVTKIQTLKIGGENKRNMKGYRQIKLSTKRAKVTLKEKESISIFEEKKK